VITNDLIYDVNLMRYAATYKKNELVNQLIGADESARYLDYNPYSYEQPFTSNSYIYLNNEGNAIIINPVKNKEKIICSNVIQISKYGNNCLYSNSRGNSYIQNNDKLEKVGNMKNIIQKVGNLFLSHNGHVYINNKCVQLSNVIQITARNYALMGDGKIFKINSTGSAVRQMDINLMGIKQILSLCLLYELIILMENGTVFYYSRQTKSDECRLTKDQNLLNIKEILLIGNVLYALNDKQINIINLYQKEKGSRIIAL
jgi:hypothetical protein